MSTPNANYGQKGTASSPSAIANSQHHYPTTSQKTVAGSPIAIDTVVATSTTLTPVSNFALVRVVNRSNAVAYFWAGAENDPTASVAISAANGVALPPNSVETFCCPASSDPQKSICVKASDVQVHLVVMKG